TRRRPVRMIGTRRRRAARPPESHPMRTVADAGAPDWTTWLDSMEGVPEWPQPAESPAEKAKRGTLRSRTHDAFAWVGTVLPGLGLALGVAAAGGWVAGWFGTFVLGFPKSPVSEITVAVVLGLLIRNTVGLPAIYERG